MRGAVTIALSYNQVPSDDHTCSFRNLGTLVLKPHIDSAHFNFSSQVPKRHKKTTR